MSGSNSALGTIFPFLITPHQMTSGKAKTLTMVGGGMIVVG